MIPRWPALLLASVVSAGGAAACVVAQDLGPERPKGVDAGPIDSGSGVADDETGSLVLEPDPVMTREQACPLSEPEAWSPCPLTQADAPCMYPIHDPKTGAQLETSAICACVYAGDLQDLAGTAIGRWACVGATVRRLGLGTALHGTSCAGSFLVKRPCADDECKQFCPSSSGCVLYCRCDDEGRVRCE